MVDISYNVNALFPNIGYLVCMSAANIHNYNSIDQVLAIANFSGSRMPIDMYNEQRAFPVEAEHNSSRNKCPQPVSSEQAGPELSEHSVQDVDPNRCVKPDAQTVSKPNSVACEIYSLHGSGASANVPPLEPHDPFNALCVKFAKQLKTAQEAKQRVPQQELQQPEPNSQGEDPSRKQRQLQQLHPEEPRQQEPSKAGEDLSRKQRQLQQLHPEEPRQQEPSKAGEDPSHKQRQLQQLHPEAPRQQEHKHSDAGEDLAQEQQQRQQLHPEEPRQQ